MKKIAVGDLGEFWYGDYKEPFVQLEGAVTGYPQGVILKSDDGKVLCPYCGRTYENLSGHVGTHGMTSRSFKQEVGLLQKSALIGERLRTRRIAGGERVGRRNLERRITFTSDVARRVRLRAIASGDAAAAATYTPERLNKTGRCYAQVLAAARSVVAETGHLSKSQLSKRGIGAATVSRYFGTYDELRAQIGAKAHPKGGGPRWSKEDLVSALRSLASDLGRSPSASDLRRYGLPTWATFNKRFGSWNNAKIAAGLPVHAPTPMSDEMELSVLSGYASLGNYSVVADRLGISNSTARSVLARYGVPIPPFRGPNPANRRAREWAAEIASRLAGTATVDLSA